MSLYKVTNNSHTKPGYTYKYILVVCKNVGDTVWANINLNEVYDNRWQYVRFMKNDISLLGEVNYVPDKAVIHTSMEDDFDITKFEHLLKSFSPEQTILVRNNRIDSILNNFMDFKTLHPEDLSWLTHYEVMQAICNTFPSKILDESPRWTIIESDWQILDKDDKYNIVRYKDNIINEVHKVYFYISTEDYIILRGDSAEQIANYVASAKLKNTDIIDTKTDYTNGEKWFSTILKGRQFPRILTSTALIKCGKDSAIVEGEYHFLNNMGCGSDPSIGEESIAYYSDLLIGSNVRIKAKQKQK